MRRWRITTLTDRVSAAKRRLLQRLARAGEILMLVATLTALVLGGKFALGAMRVAADVTGGEAVLWWALTGAAAGATVYLSLEAYHRLKRFYRR